MKKVDLMLDGVFLNNVSFARGKLGINLYIHSSDSIEFLGHISFKNHKLIYYKNSDFYELVKK